MPDVHGSFARLRAATLEGVDYRVELRRTGSAVAHIAVHGGGIEPGTAEAALAAAELNGQSSYSFVALRPRRNSALHITSTRFDEPECVALQQSCRRTVSYHGCAGTEPVIRLGGGDREAGGLIGRALQTAGFAVDWNPAQELSGSAARNICNRNLGGAGVQLELSAALRRLFFPGADTSRAMRESGRRTSVFARFVEAVATASALFETAAFRD